MCWKIDKFILREKNVEKMSLDKEYENKLFVEHFLDRMSLDTKYIENACIYKMS
jgi:hypothetical protein